MRFLAIIFLFVVNTVSSQTGTVADPFVSLNQSHYATSPGIYHFNISGNTFSTYVDANKWVLVLIDFGNQSGDLIDGSSLSTSSRGKLSATILSSLTETAALRISSSDAEIDFTTTNSSLINRLRSNTTLHKGLVDNGINNDWTGTNSNYITDDAICTSNTYGSTLNTNVVWTCGNSQTGFHLIPSGGYQRFRWNDGEIAGTTSLRLWAKGVVPLPIELNYFKGLKSENSNELNWQTSSERNNKEFILETSTDGKTWEFLSKTAGNGNAVFTNDYSFTHYEPKNGINYYRLKQVDFDGEVTELKTVSIDNSTLVEVSVFPNPAKNFLTITSNEKINKVYLVDMSGRTIHQQENTKLDVSFLPKGVYYLKLSLSSGVVETVKFIKE